MTFLRSLYDVAINYAADTVLGGLGDFQFLFSGYPRFAVHACAWIVMLLGAFGAVREIALVRYGTRNHSTEDKKIQRSISRVGTST